MIRAILRGTAGRWEGRKSEQVVQELVHVFHPKLGPEDEELLSSWLTSRSSASGVLCFVAIALQFIVVKILPSYLCHVPLLDSLGRKAYVLSVFQADSCTPPGSSIIAS